MFLFDAHVHTAESSKCAKWSGAEAAEAYAAQANKKGFPTVIKAEPVNGKTMYRVQCGAFSSRQNAISFADRIKAAGFDAVIKEVQIA